MITVDRIEGNRAILVLGAELVEVPVALLPAGAGEGSVLALVLDGDAERSARQAAADRLKRLQGRDDLPEEIEL